jgi:hypothetical protein
MRIECVFDLRGKSTGLRRSPDGDLNIPGRCPDFLCILLCKLISGEHLDASGYYSIAKRIKRRNRLRRSAQIHTPVSRVKKSRCRGRKTPDYQHDTRNRLRQNAQSISYKQLIINIFSATQGSGFRES